MIDDLPPPLGPHSATTSPGAACSERPVRMGRSGRSLYVKCTSTKRTSPRQRLGVSGEAGAWIVGCRCTHLMTLSAAPRACARAV